MCEAAIGLLGALIGAIAAIGAVVVQHYLRGFKQEKIDAPRRAMLKQMLEKMPEDKEWRNIETLSRVIGADRADTTRLLIEIEARGSESENDVWALISKKPLP